MYADNFKIGTCFINKDKDYLLEVVKDKYSGELCFRDIQTGKGMIEIDEDTHFEVDKSEYYKVVTSKAERDEECDEWDSLEIFENNESIFYVNDSVFDASDNTLRRNFSDCHNICDLLKKFYEYGKKGVIIDFE